jgi:hypothetical protein
LGLYYKNKINGKINLRDNYFVFNEKEMKAKEIQPKIIYKIIESKDENILHIVINE